MAWLRIDDGFDHHPKMLELGSDQRRWTWIRVLVYTCRFRSPAIPSNIGESIPRATRQFLSECVEIGLIDITDNGTYEVHDWDDYNGSDSKLLVRERVRKHRASNAESNGEVTDESVTTTLPEPLQERSSRAGTRARPRPQPHSVETAPVPEPLLQNAGAGAGAESDLEKINPLAELALIDAGDDLPL